MVSKGNNAKVEKQNIENIGKQTEQLDLDDMTREGYEYTYVSKGEPTILTVKSIEKDYSADENQLSSVDYAIVIKDTDGDKVLINTWTVFNGIKKAYREASKAGHLDSTEGLMLFIKNHDERGKYTIKWNVKGEEGAELESWQTVDLDD